MPPGRYVERVRLETARRHLEDTAEGIEQTARACGYRTTEAMRRAFIEALGVSPAEYRRRFRPSASSPDRPFAAPAPIDPTGRQYITMQIVIALFDRFTALDAVGPHQVLHHLPDADVIFAAERAARCHR